MSNDRLHHIREGIGHIGWDKMVFRSVALNGPPTQLSPQVLRLDNVAKHIPEIHSKKFLWTSVIHAER